MDIVMADVVAAPWTDRCAAIPPVLFVDLDGTLIRTDLLWESLMLAVKRQPRVLGQVPGWLRRGMAFFKQVLA